MTNKQKLIATSLAVAGVATVGIISKKEKKDITEFNNVMVENSVVKKPTTQTWGWYDYSKPPKREEPIEVPIEENIEVPTNYELGKDGNFYPSNPNDPILFKDEDSKKAYDLQMENAWIKIQEFENERPIPNGYIVGWDGNFYPENHNDPVILNGEDAQKAIDELPITITYKLPIQEPIQIPQYLNPTEIPEGYEEIDGKFYEINLNEPLIEETKDEIDIVEEENVTPPHTTRESQRVINNVNKEREVKKPKTGKNKQNKKKKKSMRIKN